MAGNPIDAVPVEIITYILNFLDSPSYFETRLRDDPAEIFPPPQSDAWARSTTIKNASLVCHHWRSAILPLLFRHVFWNFERLKAPSDADPRATADAELAFLRREQLTRHVRSLTIAVERHETGLSWEASLGGDESSSGDGPSQQSSSAAAAGNDPVARKETAAGENQSASNNWLWHAIFRHLDPLRITIIGHPTVLASLLLPNNTIYLGASWAFQAPFHIVSLSRPPTDAGPTSSPRHPAPWELPSGIFSTSDAGICDLFAIRPWDSLLVNEGSFVSVYGTYEYFHYTPPSLLPLLLNALDPSLLSFLSGRLKSFSYIAIFPPSPHPTRNIILGLPSTLQHLYVQVVPRNADFLDGEYRRASIDLSDLWMERNSIYAEIMQAVFSAQGEAFQHLEVFETGDASDKEAWEVAIQYVEVRGGWRVEREGMFVRDVSNTSQDTSHDSGSE